MNQEDASLIAENNKLFDSIQVPSITKTTDEDLSISKNPLKRTFTDSQQSFASSPISSLSSTPYTTSPLRTNAPSSRTDDALSTRHVFTGCPRIDNYSLLDQVGQGTFGAVYRARDKRSGEYVAIKQILLENEKEGFPITALRELKFLQRLKHENIVRLHGMGVGAPDVDEEQKSLLASESATMAGNIPEDWRKLSKQHRQKYIQAMSKVHVYMIFEWMEHDLTGLLENPSIRFTEPQIKCYMQQLFEGLHYLHSHRVLHRDMKGSNLLINNKGILKIADFGLARHHDEHTRRGKYTNRVVTLWYRAPELLFGSVHYDAAIDLWACGLILAEMTRRHPLVPGTTEIEQLGYLGALLGRPNPTAWLDKLPLASTIQWQSWPSRRALRDVLVQGTHVPSLVSTTSSSSSHRPPPVATAIRDPLALDLIESLLSWDPSQRPTADKLRHHPYFSSAPLPAVPSSLPRYMPSHEYKGRQMQAMKRQALQQGQSTSAPAPVAEHTLHPPRQERHLPTAPSSSSSLSMATHSSMPARQMVSYADVASDKPPMAPMHHVKSRQWRQQHYSTLVKK